MKNLTGFLDVEAKIEGCWMRLYTAHGIDQAQRRADRARAEGLQARIVTYQTGEPVNADGWTETDSNLRAIARLMNCNTPTPMEVGP
jgi:hypothetical protein